jgi:hypothetical protein
MDFLLQVFSLQTATPPRRLSSARTVRRSRWCFASLLLPWPCRISFRRALLHAVSGLFLQGFAAYLLALHVFSLVPPFKRMQAKNRRHSIRTAIITAPRAPCATTPCARRLQRLRGSRQLRGRGA